MVAANSHHVVAVGAAGGSRCSGCGAERLRAWRPWLKLAAGVLICQCPWHTGLLPPLMLALLHETEGGSPAAHACQHRSAIASPQTVLPAAAMRGW